jgi:hypothetical protein
MNDHLKFTLRRHYLNSQGYDGSGSYYGAGAPLYWYSSECKIEGEYREDMIRARSRDDAKAQVRKLYPSARFYR